MRIVSSAPTRIDLAGGTYDIWPLYLFHERAETINAAITLRAECTLESLPGEHVVLVSDDTGERVEAPRASELDVSRLPLIGRLVRHFNPGGVEVRTRSGLPVGAGIAGSSAMNVAVAGALAAFTSQPMSADALLTLAMNIEAQVIAVPTGVQDYRPAYYGGVSAIELGVTGVRRVALAVDAQELTRRIVVAYTGASRQSGINNWDVTMRRIGGDPGVIAAFDGIRDAAIGMRTALEAGDWTGAAGHLAREWDHRKRLAPGVTTPALDRLLAAANTAGALAGKVCGAGGGGCLFCLVPPGRKPAVVDALGAGGAQVLDVAVDSEGLRIQ